MECETLIPEAEVAGSVGFNFLAPQEAEGGETVVDGDADDGLGGEDGLAN
jgi:hypothetical protein